MTTNEEKLIEEALLLARDGQAIYDLFPGRIGRLLLAAANVELERRPGRMMNKKRKRGPKGYHVLSIRVDDGVTLNVPFLFSPKNKEMTIPILIRNDEGYGLQISTIYMTPKGD